MGNKVKVIDMFTKKQKFLPPEEWVMFKDETGEIAPAIVSEALWEQANVVLRRRSDDVKNRQNVCSSENLLTSKLYCTCCGTPYYRKESKSRKGIVNSKWVCSGKIKNGAHPCDSIPLYEDELKPILLEVFQDTKVDTEALSVWISGFSPAKPQKNTLKSSKFVRVKSATYLTTLKKRLLPQQLLAMEFARVTRSIYFGQIQSPQVLSSMKNNGFHIRFAETHVFECELWTGEGNILKL